MAETNNKKALTDAADKLAEQASNDGVGADKAKEERASAEQKVTSSKERGGN